MKRHLGQMRHSDQLGLQATGAWGRGARVVWFIWLTLKKISPCSISTNYRHLLGSKDLTQNRIWLTSVFMTKMTSFCFKMSCFCYTLEQRINNLIKQKSVQLRKRAGRLTHFPSQLAMYQEYLWTLPSATSGVTSDSGSVQKALMKASDNCLYLGASSCWLEGSYTCSDVKRPCAQKSAGWWAPGMQAFPHQAFPASQEAMLASWGWLSGQKKMSEWPWNGMGVWLSVCLVCNKPRVPPQLRRRRKKKRM